MSRISIQSPDGGNSSRPSVPSMPQRDLIVSQQVGTLLAAANSLMAFIANTRLQEEGAEVKPIDGGVKSSVEATLMGICNRMDKIMSDDNRWTMEIQNTLEYQLSRLYAEHQATIAEQREAMRLSVAPQTRLSPKLIKINNGATWVAFIGDPTGDDCVLGMGSCVQDALDNFDRAVEGKPVGFITEWLKSHETIEVDQEGNQQTEVSAREPVVPRDRPRPRKDPKIRRAKARKTPRRRRSGETDPGGATNPS